MFLDSFDFLKTIISADYKLELISIVLNVLQNEMFKKNNEYMYVVLETLLFVL